METNTANTFTFTFRAFRADALSLSDVHECSKVSPNEYIPASLMDCRLRMQEVITLKEVMFCRGVLGGGGKEGFGRK